MNTIKSLTINQYFVAFFFLAINLLIYGYNFGNNSYHDQTLPFINKLIDPFLYPHDAYLTTIKMYPTIYINTMAFLGKFLSLEKLHFYIYLAVKYIFFLVIYVLAQYLFQNKNTSLLSVFIFALAPLSNCFGLIGDEPVMKFILYQTSLAIPFLLFSIYLFLRQRYRSSLILLSLILYLNGLPVLYVTVMLAFASLAAMRKGIEPPVKKALFQSWGIFLALLCLWFSWLSNKISFQSASPDFILFLKCFYTGHYFPLSWPIEKWLMATCYLVFFILIFKQSMPNQDKRTLNAFLASILFMWFIAFIFAEIIPLRMPTILMFFRSDIFLVVFSLLYSAHYVQQLISSQKASHPLMGYFLTLTLVNIQLFSSNLAIPSAGLFVIFLLKEQIASKHLNRSRIISLGYKIYLIFFLALCAFLILKFPIYTTTYLLTFIILGFLYLAEQEPMAAITSSRHVFLFILTILLFYGDLIQYRITTHQLSYEEPWQSDWKSLQFWAQDSTPKEAMFIVPPYINGFRTFSKRSVFVERIDGAAMHWYKGFETEWAKRLEELGYGHIPQLQYQAFNLNDPLTVKTRMIYAANDETRLMALADKYKAHFVVEESFRRLSFPLIYQNNSFSVYQISNPTNRRKSSL